MLLDKPIDAETTAQILNEAMNALEKVESVLIKENELLAAGEIQIWRALFSEKEGAVQTYAALFVKLRRFAVAIKRFCPEELEALREKHERFMTALAKNETILAALRGVSEAILLEVAKELQGFPPQAYGPGASGAPSAPALKISQML